MGNKNFLSVVVPVYNGGWCLGQCLAGIQRSSYREYELIVVDNGSTDNSVAIAQAHGALVTADGADDLSRPAIFTASTQVMTPGGILPLSGEIDGATNLPEAIAGFNPAIRKALADLREEDAAMQRERASQIVVPGRTAPPPPPDLLIR